MSLSRGKQITSWVLQVILAALFLLAGMGKFAGGEATREMFADWGLPDGFHIVIGVLEILGAIGLLIPRTIGWAALGLIGIMVGAFFTHLLNHDGLGVLRPVIFMAPLVVIAMFRMNWPWRD